MSITFIHFKIGRYTYLDQASSLIRCLNNNEFITPVVIRTVTKTLMNIRYYIIK